MHGIHECEALIAARYIHESLSRGIPIGMDKTKGENFLNVPPCPFRRVSFGTAHCTISTDSHVSEIDPLTCMNCEVPALISKPRCQYLSLGTELKPYRGEGRLVTSMACRALNIRLYSLKTCDECPLYSEIPSLAEILKADQDIANIQIPVRESVFDEIIKDIKLDYGVMDDEDPPVLPIRCWRFPEGHCRRSPIYTRRKVTVVLANNERDNELYKSAIVPAIKELNLIPFRIDDELLTDEEMCRVCESFQESDYAVISLDDWSTNSIFMLGILYGMGRKLALLKNSSLQPVPLIECMAHEVVNFIQPGELKDRLMEHFMAYVKPDHVERE